jgi:hypothetical protein
MSIGSGYITIFPASILEMSRTSLTSSRRWLALPITRFRTPPCESVSGPYTPSPRSWL